jgi:hypothetical protein
MASGRVGTQVAKKEPDSVPITRPGAKLLTMSQRTAPWAWCARMLAIEVSTMVAIEVPNARCMLCSTGKACAVNSMNSRGTMVRPPPTPNRPATKPAKTPSSG